MDRSMTTNVDNIRCTDHVAQKDEIRYDNLALLTDFF